jgi:CRISPR/Cas system CMR subunit Cmr4 (Cas7 group RAMP superfamily)
MGIIKSAAEIAKEKLEKIGEPTEQERLKWKYGPEGEKLAALYLKNDVSLVNEIKKYDEKAKEVIAAGVNDILLRNINLPRNEAARRTNKKAMDGLKTLKNDKAAVENVYSRMRHVLDHYVQEGAKQKKEAYESLKAEFEEKIQQAIRQQTGVNARMKIDVEKQPQFQEEWQRMQAQMESQYMNLLDEYKKELAAIK